LKQYGLPHEAVFDADKVLGTMSMDKKRMGRDMNYVMLERIGKAQVVPMPVSSLVKEVKALSTSFKLKKGRSVK
jgi:3-dehydroquinate synthetase